MTPGLLLEIVTGFPDDPAESVTVSGIARFCPTVPPVTVKKFPVMGEMVSERLVFAVCWGLPESCTVTVAVLVPAVMGVPLIKPLPGLIASPAGRPVADHV
jgi:hypothetical protein